MKVFFKLTSDLNIHTQHLITFENLQTNKYIYEYKENEQP